MPEVVSPVAGPTPFVQRDFSNAASAVNQPSEWVRFDGRIYVVTPAAASKVGALLVRRPGMAIHRVVGHLPTQVLAIAYSAHNIRVARYAYPGTIRYHQTPYQVQVASAPPEITAVVGYDRGMAVGRIRGISPNQSIGLMHGVMAPALTATRIR
jgi:hypothetical protein